jgi:hypothetical protein
MSKIETIYSLRELKNILEKHDNKDKLMIYFDIDLTLIEDNEENKEVLIEPEETKKLFDYILKNGILFSFITARFHDTACNKKKRNLEAMKKDIDESIFPMLEEIGLDIRLHKNKELEKECYPIKNKGNKCVGILYRGIFFSSKKGETIKHYHKNSGLEKTHPYIIFVDDLDYYLEGVARNVPNALTLKRKIKNDL